MPIMTKLDKPCFSTQLAINIVIESAGPVTAKRLLPKMAATIPLTTAVVNAKLLETSEVSFL